MGPKRSDRGKKKVIGTVVRSTKRVVKETVKVSVVQGGNTQEESTQEIHTASETQEVDDHNHEVVKETVIKKTIPVQEVTQEQVTEEEEEESEREEEKEVKKVVKKQEKKESREEKKTQKGKGKGKEKEGKKKKRKGSKGRKGGVVSYKRYVYRVLKQVHPDLRISSMGMGIINSMMNDMFERLADEATKLSQYTHRMTLSSREVQDAVKLVLPGELGKHAISEGSKALNNYVSYDRKGP